MFCTIHVSVQCFKFDNKLVIDFMLFSDDFKNHFAKYGEVIDCVLMKEPQTGRPRGFGFVTYKDPSCVDIVLSNAATMTLNGKQVSIALAQFHMALQVSFWIFLNMWRLCSTCNLK